MAFNLRRKVGGYSATLKVIRDKAIETWKNPKHRFFTDHTPEGHSERVIDILNHLCDDLMKIKAKRLNTQELFILLASAYLHDIGMQYGKDPKLTLIEIRDRHHLFSEEMILGSIEDRQDYRDLGVPEEYADEIAKVSKGHRQTDLTAKEYDPKNKGGEQIRLRLLAALLSLADELDLSYKRVILENLKLESVPREDRIHWWRCYYVEGVSIEDGKICIGYEFPTIDYKEAIVPSIENQIETKMDDLRDILWDAGIRLHIGENRIEYSKTKIRMSKEDFDFLRGRQDQIQKTKRKRTQSVISDIVKKTQEIAGLNAKLRHYEIYLRKSKQKPGLILGEVFYSALISNESDVAKPLFQDGKVCDGITSIPSSYLSKPPSDPEEIATFEGLRINEKTRNFKKSVQYLNSGNKEKGVRREIICDEIIEPKSMSSISYVEKFLLEKVDNISRRFVFLSFGTIEVHVNHPADILPGIFWFRASEPELRTSRTIVSPNLTIFTAEGKWMPGNGFLLSWKQS